MAGAPWESDPIVGDYEHGGFNQSAPDANADAPVGQAPSVTAAAPWSNDPVATPASPGPAPLNDNAQLVGSFGDEAQPREAATRLTPEQEAHVIQLARNGATADELRRYTASVGFGGHDNFDEVVAARDKGGGVNPNFIYQLPHIEQGGAGGSFGRGIGDTVSAGFLDELGAVADALGGTKGRENVWNSDKGFGDLYTRNLDINRGILDADEASHPHARLVGQLIGGLAIPTGLEGVGLEAGKSVLVAGGTMREARAAAASAVRNRMAVSGGAYGAAHGAGSAEGGAGSRLAGAAVGGVEGAAGSYGLTAAGQAIAEHAPAALAAVRNATGKVGGAVEDMLGANAPRLESAPDYVQIARELGIARTPATASRSGIATVAQSGLGALPGGAPVAAAADREAADLAAAAKGVATDAGNVSNRQGAGEAIAQGAQQYKATSGVQGRSLYAQRDALMGGPTVPVPTENAAASIQDMAARFPTSPAIQQLREHPAIRAIGGALPGEATTEEVPTGLLDSSGNPLTRTVTSGGEPLTLGEVTEALSHVRGVQRNLAAQSTTTSPILSRVNQLEQALKSDVMTAAQNADMTAGRVPGAEGSAVRAQQDADRFWADRSSALNGALKRPLQSAGDDTKVSGEAVYNQIYGDMNQKSGNLARLRDTWFRLPGEAKSTFAATAIDDLGRAAPGVQNDAGNAWSFQSFLTNINKLSPQARNIVFGAKADAQLNQVAAYANRLRQLDRARNFSNTAQKYFAGAFMATVGGAVMHGDLGTAAEAAMALPATWGGAKLLLATPKMRDWTVQAMKAMQGPNSETALRAITKRLGSIAASDPAIADQALGLQQHILQAVNDNAPRTVAASPQDKKQQPQGR